MIEITFEHVNGDRHTLETADPARAISWMAQWTSHYENAVFGVSVIRDSTGQLPAGQDAQ